MTHPACQRAGHKWSRPTPVTAERTDGTGPATVLVKTCVRCGRVTRATFVRERHRPARTA